MSRTAVTSEPCQAAAEAGGALREITLRLFRYCAERNWAGYDPYDALNSRLLEKTGLMRFRHTRLGISQLLKRLPINLRPILAIPACQNPKGVALFLSAAVQLVRLGLAREESREQLIQALLALRSPGARHSCWGYPFPWQSRAALFPRWIPNVICTTFAGNALLDAYEQTSNPQCLEAAISAARFLMEDLYYEEGNGMACFSYMPLARSRVHNANLLGAAFVCRAADCSGERAFVAPAIKAASFSVSRQQADGSWEYGESRKPPQQWKDSFHTGFNLNALLVLARTTGVEEFRASALRGYDFYRRHFFAPDGAPKYYHDRAFPLDIHSAAQAILTFCAFGKMDEGSVPLAQSVCNWTLKNLRARDGFFYFQKHRFYTNKIPYMRWSQAWMLLACSVMLAQERVSTGDDSFQ